MVTVACGRAAPLGSVTVPEKVPASSCPRVSGQNAINIVINRRRYECPLMKLALLVEVSGTNATSVQTVETADFIR
jgi:hypothetical protein